MEPGADAQGGYIFGPGRPDQLARSSESCIVPYLLDRSKAGI